MMKTASLDSYVRSQEAHVNKFGIMQNLLTYGNLLPDSTSSRNEGNVVAIIYLSEVNISKRADCLNLHIYPFWSVIFPF